MGFLQARATLAQVSSPVRAIILHSMLFGLAASVADLLFNFYVASQGYGPEVLGVLATALKISGAALSVPMGLLIDRAGARWSLLLALVCYSGGWVALLLAPSFMVLLLAQLLVGAAYLLGGTAVVPLLTVMTDDRERAGIFGLNASAALLVGLLGSAVGGLLPGVAGALLGVEATSTVAYRVALSSVVLLGLTAIVPLLWLQEQEKVVQPGQEAIGATPVPVRPLPLRTLVANGIPYLLMGVGGGLILPFQNLFFRQQFGLSDAAVGAVLAGVALVMGIGAALGGPLSRRLGTRRAAALLRLGSAPTMLLMLAPLLAPAVIGLGLRGLFIAASFPLNDALVMDTTPPRQRGLAVSLLSMLWSLGWAAAAALSGWAQPRWGFGPLLVLVAASYVLSGLALLFQPHGATATQHAEAPLGEG